MKAVHVTLLFALAVSACVPAATAPPSQSDPQRAPIVKARPAAPPAATTPAPTSWMDQATTPGVWRYQPSEAVFVGLGGEQLAAIQCSKGREVSVAVYSAGQGPITIRTETASQTRAASRNGMAHRTVFAPNDPMLDAIALSKGRFAVETGGMPPLYLPSWAEVSRVIEDCR